MRRLLYVPIIHEEADVGETGQALGQKSADLTGAQRWSRHRVTVRRFWESVAAYFRDLPADRLKVYQDGLPAGGAMGRRIVEQAAAMGSRNYQIILGLLDRGAELEKTEDPALLLREYESVRGSMEPGAAGDKPRDAEQDRRQRDRLLEDRDSFIAQTIGDTLLEGESGVLFMGASHSVAPRLSADIVVEMVKDPAIVLAYTGELFLGRDEEMVEKLGCYLTSPVELG